MSTAHHGPNCVIDHCYYVQLKLLHEIKKIKEFIIITTIII